MSTPFFFNARGLRQVLLSVPVVSLPALAFTAFAEDRAVPTLQDMQIAARVIGFRDQPASGDVVLGIAYDPGKPASVQEAQTIAELLGHGLPVGRVVLHPVLIPQAGLPRADHVDALFASDGVDGDRLRAAATRLHVPCLTLHRLQLGHGGCMVALRGAPTVSIVLDEANASAAGVRFATAFRMMVQEL